MKLQAMASPRLTTALLAALGTCFSVVTGEALAQDVAAARSGDAGGLTRSDAGRTLAAPDAAARDAEVVDARSADVTAEDATAATSDTGDAGSAMDADLDDGGVDAGIYEPSIPAALEAQPEPLPEAQRPRVALTAIVGLLALLVLAYLGNHPRVRRVEDALGLRSAITVGFPFVALGLIARHPAVGVLSEGMLVGMTPLVEFGLGWLGFLVGFHLDVRALDRLPRRALIVIALETALPFVAVAIACSAVLTLLGTARDDGASLRYGIVLGTAGAMTARPVIRAAFAARSTPPVVLHLDEIVGVAGLAVLAAYFRPPGVEAHWTLPGTAWLFLTVGMGATLGAVLFVSLRRPATQAEFMALTIGSVAFAAGMASYVRLSPVVICFLAGAVIANLPSEHHSALARTLERLERPIFLIFLALVGALWDPSDWRGWVLMLVFAASRYLGLGVGRALAARHDPTMAQELSPRSVLTAPLSIVAIAVVIGVRNLYRGSALPMLITAVIGGALLAEIVGAVAARARASGASRS
jgi:Kef-type K+ transport system membrane component KefB